MKIQITILLILIGINLNGQGLGYDILTEKQALFILENKGIDSLKDYIMPIELVYLNEINSKTIIDKEFSTGFLTPHPDSLGIFIYNSPETSIEIAKHYKNLYAVQRLFEYYKSLPKRIQSDTIYNEYYGLDELLSLLVFYNPTGLKETLEIDYYIWEKLAMKTPPKKYKTIEEIRQMIDTTSFSFENRPKLKKEDLIIDCNYISFQIAEALKKLGHKDFNNDFLTELKKKQTYTYIKEYSFPIFYNENMGEHILDTNYEVIELPNNKYHKIKDLIEVPNKLEELFIQKGTIYEEKLINVLHDDKQTAYVEFLSDIYEVAYIIKLENNKLLFQFIWSMNI